MKWRKASRSNSSGGNCVEAAATGRTVAVRDSKKPDGPALVVSARRWTTFVDDIRSAKR